MSIVYSDPTDPTRRQSGPGLKPIFAYPVDEFVRQLHPYRDRPEYDSWIELHKKLWNSKAYIYHSWAVPSGAGAQLNFATYETKTFAIQMPPGTYVTMINGYFDEAEGFVYQITDKGGMITYVDNDMVKNEIGAGDFVANTVNPPSDGDVVPFGGGLIHGPFIIVDPGAVQVEITSLADSTQNIQLYLACAVPVGAQSLGTQIVRSV